VKEFAVSDTRYSRSTSNDWKFIWMPDDSVDDPDGFEFDEYASSHRRSILQRERQSLTDTIEPEL
jgi:hypothetical protein